MSAGISLGMTRHWRIALERLHAGGDREHEMLGNRLVIGAIALAYALLAVDGDLAASFPLIALCTGFFAGGILLAIHAIRRPGVSETRRLLAVTMDIGALSFALHVGGAVASPFFPVYFWVVLGNGFRFGLRSLKIATGLSVVGFSFVLLDTAYWIENQALGLGLLAGLIAIPLYAQTLIRKLSAAKRQAEAANQAKSLFLASVSHELRTPLNAVIGMGSLIASTPLNAEQREMANTITSASTSLLSLIDDILDLSRIEAGQMPVTSVAFDLNDLLREVMAIVELKAREKNLHVALHVTARTPLDVVGDARHLREILLNLVANAVKFTSSGGVTVMVDASTDPDGLKVRFEVADTGIGIAEAAQCRIFEAFSQADGTILNRFGGTGLGLAITRRLVLLMGGSIELQSAEGQGSVFVVSLPLGRGVLDPARLHGTTLSVSSRHMSGLSGLLERLDRLGCRVVVEPESPAGQTTGVTRSSLVRAGLETPGAAYERSVLIMEAGSPSKEQRQRFATVITADAPDEHLITAIRVARANQDVPDRLDSLLWTRPRPLRVLVADDNRVNARVLQMVLERAGHSVTIVEDGEQAVEVLTDTDFDIVLMDLNMPVLDGLQATKLFRFCALGRSYTPVIGLTADVTSGVEARCREAGMDGCLSKPIEPRLLLDSIDAAVLPVAPQRNAGWTASAAPVLDITAHPRFRASHVPAVDAAVLSQLRTLGGDAFVDDLIRDFLADADRLGGAISVAAAAGDTAAVAFHAHALLSAAGNMGAEPLRQVCRNIQNLGMRELAHASQQGFSELAFELQRVTVALDASRSHLPSKAGRLDTPIRLRPVSNVG